MIKPIAFTFVVRFTSAVFNFLVIILLSQYLGPEGKGVCTQYITVIANALIFCDFIGGPPLVFLAAKYRTTSLLWPSYLWSALTSVVTIYMFQVFGIVASHEFGYLVILSFLNSCIAIHQNILSGKMKFFQLNLIVLLQSLLLFFCLKYFFSLSDVSLLAGPSPLYYVLSLGLAWGASALLGFIFLMTAKKSGEAVALPRFLSEAYRFGFMNLSGHALQFINQRLSYFLLGPHALGIFSNATSVGESLWLVSNSIATVQYGKISNMKQNVDRERLTLLFFKLNFLLCLAGCCMLVLFPDAFFISIFGAAFSGIHPLLMILAPGLLFFSAYLILGHHFSGCGHFQKNIYCILTGLLITALGLSVVFFIGQEFNSGTAAAITSCSYFGNFMMAVYIFRKDAGIRWQNFFPSADDVLFLKKEIKSGERKD